jgi:hypothetical protein
LNQKTRNEIKYKNTKNKKQKHTKTLKKKKKQKGVKLDSILEKLNNTIV